MKPTASPNLWRPIRVTIFRNLLIADVISDAGAFIQNVGAAWLMVSLGAGPIYIALTQTAASLPYFLLALPAGSAGDVFDRRKLILFTESWMMAVALLLAVLTIAGFMSPWLAHAGCRQRCYGRPSAGTAVSYGRIHGHSGTRCRVREGDPSIWPHTTSRWRISVGVYRDTEVGDRYLEIFLVNSWAEHLRQHERQIQADRGVEQRLSSYVVAEPKVRHLIYANSIETV